MRADTVDVTGKSHPHARMVLEDRCLPGPDIALPQPCTNTTEPNMLRRLVLREYRSTQRGQNEDQLEC